MGTSGFCFTGFTVLFAESDCLETFINSLNLATPSGPDSLILLTRFVTPFTASLPVPNAAPNAELQHRLIINLIV